MASRVELNFPLRPLSDLWEAGRFGAYRLPNSPRTLGFYGPDVDTGRHRGSTANTATSSPLETSRSDVVDQIAIDNLPLTGRDVYTMLLLLPGVTADTGTARGLGFSTFGQRPTSSDYLLDGADNNFLLATGPLNAPPPEFIQEYRVSTGNYTAEYRAHFRICRQRDHEGRGQCLARRRLPPFGKPAPECQRISGKCERLCARSDDTGGRRIHRRRPIVPRKLFLSGGFDRLRTKSLADCSFALPTLSFIQSLSFFQLRRRTVPEFSAASSATSLGKCRAGPNRASGGLFPFGRVCATGLSALGRRSYIRAISARRTRPAAVSLQSISGVFHSFPAGFALRRRQLEAANRRRVPERVARCAVGRFGALQCAQLRRAANKPVRERRHRPERADVSRDSARPAKSVQLSQSRGVAGSGGHAHRGSGTPSLEGGRQLFPADHRLKFGIRPRRRSPVRQLCGPDQRYSGGTAGRSRSLRLGFRARSARSPISLPPGLRLRAGQLPSDEPPDAGLWPALEWYGSPANTGSVKDSLIELARGPNIEAALTGAVAVLPPSNGDETVYSSAGLNLAPRAGLAWDVTGSGKTILRASYGLFYDRPYDNLWENVIQNRYQTVAFQNFTSPLAVGSTTSAIEAAGTYRVLPNWSTALLFNPAFERTRAKRLYGYSAACPRLDFTRSGRSRVERPPSYHHRHYQPGGIAADERR